MKSPLYLTKNLSGGQMPHALWHWHVGVLFLKRGGGGDRPLHQEVAARGLEAIVWGEGKEDE